MENWRGFLLKKVGALTDARYLLYHGLTNTRAHPVLYCVQAFKTATKNNWKRWVALMGDGALLTVASHPATPEILLARLKRAPSLLTTRRRWFVFDASTLTLKYYASEAPGQKEKGVFVLDPTEAVIVDATNDHGKPNELKITSNGQVLYAAADTMEAARDLLQRIDLARRAKIVGDDGQNLIKLEDGEKALAASYSSGEPGAKAFTWGVGSMLGIGNSSVQGMALPQRVQSLKPP